MQFVSDDSGERVPMDPEDHAALLAWVKAKEGRGETTHGHKTFHPRL